MLLVENAESHALEKSPGGDAGFREQAANATLTCFGFHLLIQTARYSSSLKAIMHVEKINVAAGSQTAETDNPAIRLGNPQSETRNPLAPAGKVWRLWCPGGYLL